MCDGCMKQQSEPRYLNGESMLGEYEREHLPPTKEILIARIQQMFDHLAQWHREIQGERILAEREEKKELDWPTETLMLDLLDQFHTQFDDILSDKSI